MSVIEFDHVWKRFGSTEALQDVCLSLPAGHIVGLLGDNGAGKSTLIRHAIGLYLPDRGTCRTLGVAAAKLGPEQLARIGYVHQGGEMLDWLTARQHIDYVAAHYDTWDPNLEAGFIDRFEIPLTKRVGVLSPGQRQRLAILLAIGAGPDLLLLDEPAAGLDPIARLEFLELLLEIIQDTTKTIVISSHVLSDVEKVIDHVLLMRHGRIICDAPYDELQETYCRLRLTALAGHLPGMLPFDPLLEVRRSIEAAELIARRPAPDLLARIAREHRIEVDLEPLPLEDLYRALLAASRKDAAA